MTQAPVDGRASFADWDGPAYALHRPTYPADLFDALTATCARRETAWDCASGSGQATAPLLERFARVVATDIHRDQLRAGSADFCGILSDACAAPLRDGTVDLVVVAQALHWFARDEFFNEVARVARGGVFAAWSYGLFQVQRTVDDVVRWFYDDVVGDYWPPERRFIETEYVGIEFPFATHQLRRHAMTREWTASEALAYLGTWSAVRRYRDAMGHDPLDRVAERLHDAWGSGPRTVTWPLAVHVCRVS